MEVVRGVVSTTSGQHDERSPKNEPCEPRQMPTNLGFVPRQHGFPQVLAQKLVRGVSWACHLLLLLLQRHGRDHRSATAAATTNHGGRAAAAVAQSASGPRIVGVARLER